jgi:hypothetical protein
LHTDQAVGVTRKMVKRDALAKVHCDTRDMSLEMINSTIRRLRILTSTIIECLPIAIVHQGQSSRLLPNRARVD